MIQGVLKRLKNPVMNSATGRLEAKEFLTGVTAHGHAQIERNDFLHCGGGGELRLVRLHAKLAASATDARKKKIAQIRKIMLRRRTLFAFSSIPKASTSRFCFTIS